METAIEVKTFKKEEVVHLFKDLYEQVKHGDDDHQKWLKDKIENFVSENIINK